MLLEELINLLKPNSILKGNLFPEQVHVIIALPFGNAIKLIGRGDSNQVYDLVIPEDKFSELEFVEQGSYNGDATKFRLASRLKISHASGTGSLVINTKVPCLKLTP